VVRKALKPSHSFEIDLRLSKLEIREFLKKPKPRPVVEPEIEKKQGLFRRFLDWLRSIF